MIASILAVACVATCGANADLVAHWTLDEVTTAAPDATGRGNDAVPRGDIAPAGGAVDGAARFDGLTGILEAPPDGFDFTGDFSVTAWVNTYVPELGQQMIIAKNRYSLGEREWGLMVDADGRFTAYIRNDGWKTAAATTRPTPGRWQHVAVVMRQGALSLFVDGGLEDSQPTGMVEAPTPAPVTIGGSNDNGRLWQMLLGALDDVRVHDHALSAEEIAAMQKDVADTHETPDLDSVRPVIWDPEQAVPGPDAIERLPDVRFEAIKLREPEVDGYRWLHGVAIYRYKGEFLTSWGANVGQENTAGEVVLGRRSRDDGETWGEVESIGPTVDGEGRSHGVFLAHEGQLWAFHSRFGKGEGTTFPGLGMEAFVLDEAADAWEPRGVVAAGFWPLREPEKMDDGNWFITGCDEDWRAAVAISHSDDLTQWDTIKIDVGGRVITEASAWIDGGKITLVMRNQSPRTPGAICAAVSFSEDHGRTWTEPLDSNMPLSTSKPYCGVLSTGQRYLIGNSVDRANNSRGHLTIAVSRPGEELLSRMWLIRDSQVPEPLRGTYGYADPQNLAYPHAIEHEGTLYVVYSAGHLPANQNSAELAVIPVADLAVPTPER